MRSNFKKVYWPWLMCGFAALFYCYEFFLRVAPSVTVSAVMHRYSIHAVEFGILSACYYYAYTPIQLLVGTLMDLHGVRRLLTVSTLLCALGAYLFIATKLFWVAALSRSMIGFGSAFAFVGVLKLAADWLPENRLALVSGLATALGMLGAISGEVQLNQLINAVGWEEAFVISGVAGLILALLIWYVIRDRNPPEKVSLSKKELSHICSRLWQIAKNAQLWINGIIGGTLFMPTSIFAVIWGVSYLNQALGVPMQDAANMTTMIFVGWVVGSPFMGWLSDRLGNRDRFLMLSCLSATILMCILFYVPHLSHTNLYFLLFFFGFASSPQILVFAIACELSPHASAGTAAAFTNMIVMSGGALFPPIIGAILDRIWHGHFAHGLRYYSNFDYQIAFAIMPITLFIGFILTFFLKETHCKHIVD